MSLQGKSFAEMVEREYGLTVKDLLEKMYWSEKKDQKQIAAILGVTRACICQNFKKYDIKKRPFGHWSIGFKVSEEHKQKIRMIHKGKILSKETRKKISKAMKGRKSTYHDRRKRRHDGYIAIRIPEHPFSNKDGYVMEHRLVVEKKIGRYLKPEEVVHHINGIRNDNRPENLHLFASGGDHMKFHMLERYGKQEELKYEYQ